jgi:DNA polymerase-3 subunit delta
LIVQNALFFASKPKKAESKDTLDALNAYMENPAEETVLIFYTPKKLDGKKKIVKTLKKQGVVLDLEDHTDGTVKNIVADYLKNEKVEIDKYALEELLNRTHYSLTQSMNEAEKIAGFSTGVRITIKDVQSLVPKSLEQNVFELSSSIMAGHTDRALQTLQDLLLNGETVIGLNSLLLEQIRLFLQVKILLNARLGEREIASELKVHPYRVKLAVQESRRVEKRVLETGFQSIVQLDEDLKSKNRDDVGSFQQLILKIRGLAGAR